MAEVTFNNIDKIYDGNISAVKDFNLKIRDKKFCVFVGPSGCGKSTTLRMLAGLEEITRGQIFIDDVLVNDILPKDRDIAMVFQNYALYPHMTVYENMAFGLKIRKFPKIEIDRRVQEASSILGIDDLLERTPTALSGGQIQRVAIGRTIVRKPKVFLFDEPLSNLDAKLRLQMRSEISKLHVKLQTTMIYVTHDQTEAMTMGDIIVVMKDGVIQQLDNPLRLYHNPINKFVAGFIGSPPMNFFNVEIKKEGKNVYLVQESMRIKLFSELASKLFEANYNKPNAILGIRPEDIYLQTSYKEKIDENLVKGIIEVVEPLGSISNLFINNGSNAFICQADKSIDHSSIEDSIEVVFDLHKAKIFDVDTEETVASINV